MRRLIPEAVLENYKILFVPVPDIPEYHLTKLNLDKLPEICFLNSTLRSDFIAPLSVGKPTSNSLMLTDKLGNHDFFSFMLIDAGRVPRKGFHELSLSELQTMFALYEQFILFWKRLSDKEEYIPRFSFNHDPFTKDRPGLQSIERFHSHFYFFRQSNVVEHKSSNSFFLKDVVHRFAYKDFYDPGSFLLEKVLIDLHTNFLCIPKKLRLIEETLLEKVQHGRGLGLNVLYDGTAEYFSQLEFVHYLQAMHQEMARVTSDLMHCFCVQQSQNTMWNLDCKKALQYIEKIPWLTESTKELFENFIGNLKTFSLETYEYMTKKKCAKNILAYRNFCYSFSIDLRDKNPSQFLINICPRVFSELGGAGFFSLDGYNAVIIDRKKDVFFSDAYIQKRRALQQNFRKQVQAYFNESHLSIYQK